MNKLTVHAILAAASIAMFDTAGAQQGSILDHDSNPPSPVHNRIYPAEEISLDNSLSWVERFNGDETFNTSQMLETGESLSMIQASDTGAGEMNPDAGGMDAMGVVKGIQTQSGKIKISHGPIDKYGMPEMTMVFTVADAAMLNGLETDNEVSFDVDNSSGGFVITRIMQSGDAMPVESGTAMDARGTVMSIRMEQEKVKISHGPIDKYGMPEMSMMFKVTDPAMLIQLEKGMLVDFNVDNSSGGFVITEIKPATQ